MHGALRQQLGDLRRREIGHLDARQIGDGAAIVARAARLDELEPGAREERFGVLLQAALGRHGDDEGAAHVSAPAGGQPLDPDREADRRDRHWAARAASAVRHSGRRRRTGRLPAARGRAARTRSRCNSRGRGRRRSRSGCGRHRCRARPGSRCGFRTDRARRRASRPASRAKVRSASAASSGSPAIARKRSISARVSRGKAGLRAERRLFEEAVGDLADRAAADGGDAGDRQQVGDQRVRRLRIGAGERGQHALIFRPRMRGADGEAVEVLRQRWTCG